MPGRFDAEEREARRERQEAVDAQFRGVHYDAGARSQDWPTEADIGRGVTYSPRPGVFEHGVITSFNDSVVFVCYAGDNLSKATHRRDLTPHIFIRASSPSGPCEDSQ